MNIDDIKRYSDDILKAMTEPDKSGRGYVCPVCGSGSGKHGTGLSPVKGKPGYYHCFAAGCEFEHGDILELIGKTYRLQDTAAQIEKAGQLIGRDFTNKNEWKEAPKTKEQSGTKNKNTLQNNDTKATQNIKDFMAQARAALPVSDTALQYIARRGISYETAKGAGLGYCSNYGDGMNTPAVIIPTGPDSYTARSITTNDSSRKVRKKKAGDRQGIFGIEAIGADAGPFVFVCEGEFDVLSVREIGLPAIATGGGTSKRELVEALRQRGDFPGVFIILPDNDRRKDGSPALEKGPKAARDLKKEMDAAGIPSVIADITKAGAWPKEAKDCNDFLIMDREAFRAALLQIQEAVTEKALGRVSGYLPEFTDKLLGNTPPISTRFPSFDKILDGGLHPGLIVIGALSSLGKTTFILNMADAMATAGQDVLIFSLEMSRFELISKIISRRTALKVLKWIGSGKNVSMKMAKSNLGVSDFKRWDNYSAGELQVLNECMAELQDTAARNLYIKEGLQSIGPAEIRADIERHKRMTGRAPVVMVDYLQILKSPDTRMTDKQKTDENVVAMKRISRDYNIPVIGVSSFNRDNYLVPVNMAAYKESGALEYTSDILIGLQYDGMDYLEGETDKDKNRAARIRALFKENEQTINEGKPVKIQAKILKNRSGKRGSCTLDYLPLFNLYIDTK